MKIADLKKSMDARFEQHDTRFEAIDARFDEIDVRFDKLEARIMASEGATRGHFDVVAEQLRADLKLWYEKLTAMND